MDFKLADNVQQNLKPSSSSKHAYYDDDEEEEVVVKKVAAPQPPPPPPVISPTPPVRLLPPFFFARIFLVCFMAVFCASSCMLVLISRWSTTTKPAALSIFPLATAYRGTSVPPFDFSDPVAVNVALPAIEASFQQHLSGRRTVMCAHHLAVPMAMQVCGIKDSLGDVHLMANPQVLGGSNRTIQVTEASILTCAKNSASTRFVAATFAWKDAKTQDSLWALLSGDESLLLQLAIDEMNGVKC